MYEICITEDFDAAHFLPNHPGKCANLHGHTWRIKLTIRSAELVDGMVIDFFDVKTALAEVLPDHTLLNDLLPNPTAENLARYFYDALKRRITGLTRVDVWESASSGAAYFED